MPPEMHQQSQAGAIVCAGCSGMFVPKRHWQRFCAASCRTLFHQVHGHTGTVKSVRRLKRGWSIVLHTDDAAAFQLGEQLRLVR